MNIFSAADNYSCGGLSDKSLAARLALISATVPGPIPRRL
jgi:hypothetical protein